MRVNPPEDSLWEVTERHADTQFLACGLHALRRMRRMRRPYVILTLHELALAETHSGPLGESFNGARMRGRRIYSSIQALSADEIAGLIEEGKPANTSSMSSDSLQRGILQGVLAFRPKPFENFNRRRLRCIFRLQSMGTLWSLYELSRNYDLPGFWSAPIGAEPVESKLGDNV